jgi:hypothetical protein
VRDADVPFKLEKVSAALEKYLRGSNGSAQVMTVEAQIVRMYTRFRRKLARICSGRKIEKLCGNVLSFQLTRRVVKARTITKAPRDLFVHKFVILSKNNQLDVLKSATSVCDVGEEKRSKQKTE